MAGHKGEKVMRLNAVCSRNAILIHFVLIGFFTCLSASHFLFSTEHRAGEQVRLSYTNRVGKVIRTPVSWPWNRDRNIDTYLIEFTDQNGQLMRSEFIASEIQ